MKSTSVVVQKMKTKAVLFVLNCFILIEINKAQVIRAGRNFLPTGPMPKPTPPPPPPTQPAPTTPAPSITPASAPSSKFDRTPKCYPETAKAYFLPAPPSSPKVTILDHNLKELPPSLKNVPSSIQCNVHEVSANPTLVPNSNMVSPANPAPAPNNNMISNPNPSVAPTISNRPSFEQPPPSSDPVLPDLIDEIPNLVQNKFKRLTDADVKVCDTCASMLKLPIYNFDQELLDGFLVGLGI